MQVPRKRDIRYTNTVHMEVPKKDTRLYTNTLIYTYGST